MGGKTREMIRAVLALFDHAKLPADDPARSALEAELADLRRRETDDVPSAQTSVALQEHPRPL